DRLAPLGSGVAADEDPVGIEKVGHRRALGEELGVGEHLVGVAVGTGFQDGADRLGGAHRDRAFLHDDLGAVGVLGDAAGHGLDEAEIGGAVRSQSVGLGGGVDADEQNVGGADCGGD